MIVPIVLVLVCAAPGRATVQHRPPVRCGRLSPRRELVCARRVLAVAVRHPQSRSRRYWRWREELSRRWIRDARRRLAHPRLKHLRLWECIHGGEGNSGSSAQHPNSGPLQMTPYWAGYPIADWSTVPVYVVYRDAETQLRIHEQHGDAVHWLWTQWWGDNHCFRLA